MADPSPAQEILEYPYKVRNHYTLAPMAIAYLVIAIVHAKAVGEHRCILRDDSEDCLLAEFVICIEFGIFSILLAAGAILAFLRRNKVCLRLLPERLEVRGVVGTGSYPYRNIIRACLMKTPRGTFLRLSLGKVMSFGRVTLVSRRLDIRRQWLYDDAAFDSACREIEARSGRPLEVFDTAKGVQVVTWKAMVIAIGLPAAIVGLLYLDPAVATVIFLTAVAAILGYAAWTLGDVIYRLTEKK